VKEETKDKTELEIREHSDADFLPKKCPFCSSSDLRRHTYSIREIQDLGTPRVCRRIRYEHVYFKCNSCEKVFTIEHPLIPIGTNYMPGVVEYAVSRVLERGDSIRRVTKDLNELHQVKVSVGTVEKWINLAGQKKKLTTDFSEEPLPEDFSGFISLDGTFKAVKTKKNDHNLA
jgi:transposase-like protein